MKRPSASLRRLLTVLAAVGIGALGAVAVASPALAHDVDVKGTATCDQATGDYKITWNVYNDYGTDATLDVFTQSASATIADTKTQAPIGTGSVIPRKQHNVDGEIDGVQELDGSTTGVVSLTIHAVWPSDGYDSDPIHTAQVTLDGKCAPAPDCQQKDTISFSHTLTPSPDGNGFDATVSVNGDQPACDAYPFTLVSYYAPRSHFSLPQYEFDHDYTPAGQPDQTVIDKDHSKVTLHVQIPPCNTQVDLIKGTDQDIINPLTKDSGTYNGKHILIDAFNGGSAKCTQPSVVFKSNCDGSVEVDLSNTGTNSKYPVRFTVTTEAGSQTYTVAANSSHEPIVIPADQAGDITVTSGHQTWNGKWEQPEDCAQPTIKAVSDCDSLTVTVTNPAGNQAIDAKITVGDKSATVHVAPGETSAPQKFPATAGSKAVVTIGDLVLTGTYTAPPSCGGQGGGLPKTGVDTYAIAGVALVLIGGGALLLVLTRRRRAAE